tara:strand:- start:414 stop:524 length:111 start_codon:yes stop_codon:yes gene_type:complete
MLFDTYSEEKNKIPRRLQLGKMQYWVGRLIKEGIFL